METSFKSLEQRAAEACVLTEIQLKVARRADQLAAESNARTDLNLVCWLKAEQEVLKQFWQSSERTVLSA